MKPCIPSSTSWHRPTATRDLCRLSMTFLFCLLSGLSAFAQAITGRVLSSDDNQPLPGVSIIVKGTNTGTTSRADGTYSINAQSATTLTFSFIGYETQDVNVGNRSTIDVSMTGSEKALTEGAAFGIVG